MANTAAIGNTTESDFADAPTDRQVSGPAGGYRWRICALLFFATTINYIDRQVLGVLAPDLQKILRWSELDYSYIIGAFQAAYALGLVAFGWIIDRVGTRNGYALAAVIWSVASAAHGLVRSVFGFGAARVALGFGEAGNFPGAVKAVSEWFPKRERAYAMGILNAGSNIGVIVAAYAAPWLMKQYGWQWAFVGIALLGLIWLWPWLTVYRLPSKEAKVSRAELAMIESDSPDPKAAIRWASLARYPQTWAFALGKLITDPAWWIYSAWLPKFLNTNYNLSVLKLGPPLLVIYVMADIGSIAGGWLPALLIRRGVERPRLTALLVCAVVVTPVLAVSRAANLWVCVVLLGLAVAGHQGFSANLYTLVSDTFPRRAVGSVTGLGAMFGALSGALAAPVVGHILTRSHGNYTPIFLYAGFAYIVALAVIYRFNPRLLPATFVSI